MLSQKTAFFTSILCLATLPPYESRNGHPDHLHFKKTQSLKLSEKYSWPTNEIEYSTLYEKFKRNIIGKLQEIQLSNNWSKKKRFLGKLPNRRTQERNILAGSFSHHGTMYFLQYQYYIFTISIIFPTRAQCISRIGAIIIAISL